MKIDEGWWFQAVEGFCRQTNRWTDICDCRVAFATENADWGSGHEGWDDDGGDGSDDDGDVE